MPLGTPIVNLSAPIFNKAKRSAIISRGLTRIAKKFKKVTVDTMVFSVPTGRTYKKGIGPAFTRFHRASRKGQPPAVDTGNLIRSVGDTKVSPSTHEVFVDDGKAPYGKFLERPRLDRPIMGPLMVVTFETGEMQGEITKIKQELEG